MKTKPKMKSLEMKQSIEVIDSFLELHITFIKDLNNFKFKSINSFFSFCIDKMLTYYQDKKIYKEAPEEFSVFFSRPGRKRSGLKEEDKKSLFFRITQEYYYKFTNLTFSHMLYNCDGADPNYSKQFYFKFFVIDLKDILKDYGK